MPYADVKRERNPFATAVRPGEGFGSQKVPLPSPLQLTPRPGRQLGYLCGLPSLATDPAGASNSPAI